MNDNNLESRITELEIKISFQSDQVDALNKVVTEQQSIIEVLRDDLKKVKEQLLAGGQVDPQNVKPPHY